MANNKNPSYVPDVDDNGIRKTFPTPEFVETRGFAKKYPWDTIRVNESFPILYSEMGKKSIGPFVSKMAKKHGKKFKVINQPQYECWLVACLPQTETEAIATSSNIVEVLEKVDSNASGNKQPTNIIEALDRMKERNEE